MNGLRIPAQLEFPGYIILFCMLSFVFLCLWIGITISKHGKRVLGSRSQFWLWRLAISFFALYSIHTILSVFGFYANFDLPPRIPIGVIITLGLFLFVGFSDSGLLVLESIGTRKLILFQVWRILPETLILLLIQIDLMPGEMTFTGKNFDIFAPLTAPIIFLLAQRKFIGERGIVVWNALCIFILSFTVFTAIRAVPFPFFDATVQTPNIAVAYFPVSLLPLFMVPLAISVHVFSISFALKTLTAKEDGPVNV